MNFGNCMNGSHKQKHYLYKILPLIDNKDI